MYVCILKCHLVFIILNPGVCDKVVEIAKVVGWVYFQIISNFWDFFEVLTYQGTCCSGM